MRFAARLNSLFLIHEALSIATINERTVMNARDGSTRGKSGQNKERSPTLLTAGEWMGKEVDGVARRVRVWVTLVPCNVLV